MSSTTIGRSAMPKQGRPDWWDFIEGTGEMTQEKRVEAIVRDIAHEVGYGALLKLACSLGVMGKLEDEILKQPVAQIESKLRDMQIIKY